MKNKITLKKTAEKIFLYIIRAILLVFVIPFIVYSFFVFSGIAIMINYYSTLLICLALYLILFVLVIIVKIINKKSHREKDSEQNTINKDANTIEPIFKNRNEREYNIETEEIEPYLISRTITGGKVSSWNGEDMGFSDKMNIK